MCKAVLPVLGRLRKVNSPEFKASLVYIFNKYKASLDYIDRPYFILTPTKKKKVRVSVKIYLRGQNGKRGSSCWGEGPPTKSTGNHCESVFPTGLTPPSAV